MIVDSHVHVVSSDVARYPLRPSGVGSDWFVTSPVDVDGFRAAMDGAGVDAAVLVQAFGAYTTDNSYVLDATASDRGRFAAVVIVDSAADLRTLVVEHGARGVRVFAIGDERRLDDDELWSTAAELGIPVVVATLAEGLHTLASALDRFAGVPVVLDHCGFPDLTDGPPYGRARPLLDLAEHPALHLKVTSHLLDQVDDGRDLVDRLAAVFGAERLLWGSDFPQTHDRSYPELVALGRHACSRLDAGGQVAFLGGTAHRLWPRR